MKKQEIINPVREELNKAVEKVAKKQKLQVIYDKSSDFVIIYLEPAHDYTDYVLEELGLGDKEDNPKKSGK
jgi:outer membrane protein